MAHRRLHSVQENRVTLANLLVPALLWLEDKELIHKRWSECFSRKAFRQRN